MLPFEIVQTPTGRTHVRMVGAKRTECQALSTARPYAGTVVNLASPITCKACAR